MRAQPAAFCLALLVATDAGAAEYRMSDVMRVRITAFIQDNGHDCPRARSAEAENGPYGVIMKVTCGPRDGDGDASETTYRLLIRANNEWEVEPWTE